MTQDDKGGGEGLGKDDGWQWQGGGTTAGELC